MIKEKDSRNFYQQVKHDKTDCSHKQAISMQEVRKSHKYSLEICVSFLEM
jgi:hypothetical protein